MDHPENQVSSPELTADLCELAPVQSETAANTVDAHVSELSDPFSQIVTETTWSQSELTARARNWVDQSEASGSSENAEFRNSVSWAEVTSNIENLVISENQKDDEWITGTGDHNLKSSSVSHEPEDVADDFSRATCSPLPPDILPIRHENHSTLKNELSACDIGSSFDDPYDSSPNIPASNANLSPESVIYQLKWIRHNGRHCPIVLQSANGPCPLISILNVLLLTERLKIQSGIEYQSGESLLAQIAALILQVAPEKAPEDVIRNYEQNIQDALAVLPKSQTGLDVNVHFTGPRDYELTPDMLVFDLLDIPLVHGWIPEVGDPAQPIIEKIKSYNFLVEFVIDGAGAPGEEVLLAQDWLERTQSQLTNAGLVAIVDSIARDIPCVFFRNNHFSTIIKHDDRIFALVTDQGYANEPSCVWEQIGNIEGDTEFFDECFRRRVPESEDIRPPFPQKPVETSWTELLTPEQQLEADHQLALSLMQQNELPAAAPKTQPEVVQIPSRIPSSSQSDYELARRFQIEEEEEFQRNSQREISTSRSSYQLQSTSGPRNEVGRPGSPSVGGSRGPVNQNVTRTSRSTATSGGSENKNKCVIS